MAPNRICYKYTVYGLLAKGPITWRISARAEIPAQAKNSSMVAANRAEISAWAEILHVIRP